MRLFAISRSLLPVNPKVKILCDFSYILHTYVYIYACNDVEGNERTRGARIIEILAIAILNNNIIYNSRVSRDSHAFHVVIHL